MQYLVWKGDYFQMGVERGTLLKRNGITFPLRLDRFQLEHGKRSEAILRHFFPEVCAEIRGVSEATGTDYAALASWLLCMGCCMYNLEDNLPTVITRPGRSHDLRAHKPRTAAARSECLF